MHISIIKSAGKGKLPSKFRSEIVMIFQKLVLIFTCHCSSINILFPMQLHMTPLAQWHQGLNRIRIIAVMVIYAPCSLAASVAFCRRRYYPIGEMARKVIEWSAAPRPTALRHDTAEAIMIGLWGVLQLGWLAKLPRELHQ